MAQPKERPSDLPAIDTPETRINIRKALAGLYLLQGRGSMKRCLIDAGYSRATARLVTQNGLSAEQCLIETRKLDASANPAKMLEVARRRAFACIESIDPKTAALKDVVRMLDTTEKYYGGHELPPSGAVTSLPARLESIVAVLLVARERGLPVPALPASFIDAEVVATREREAPPLTYVNAEKVDTAPQSGPASDNTQYVNRDAVPPSDEKG